MMDKKIEFLYAAITDAQELIRFIDTKTGIVVGFIGAFVVGLFSCVANIVLYVCSFSIVFWILLGLLLAVFVLSIWMILKIIKPVNNPKDNIYLDPTINMPLKFYIPSNKYFNLFYPFLNLKRFKLSEDLKNYIETLNNISDNDIVSILAYELFKVSYIRNIKNDRFNVLIGVVLILAVLFVSFYTLYNIEMKDITDLINNNTNL
jgi:hypothetical protein